MITHASVETHLDTIALFFDLAGVIAVVAGTVYTLLKCGYFLWKERSRFTIDYIRLEVGRSIALGLEFFVAGDIIRTVVTPDYYSIGLLSILVIIRTVLTYFLNKDLEVLRTTEKIN